MSEEENKAGRPTRYREEYCDLVDEYLLTSKDTIDENGKIEVNLPIVEGYLAFLNDHIKNNLQEGEEFKPVSERVLYDWRDKHELFLHSLGKLVKEQKKRLIDRGLSSDYNPTIAKLMLSSNHNMREKSDVTSNDQTITGNAITFIDDEKGS